MAPRASHSLYLLVLAIPALVAQSTDDPLGGGIFRYGTIYWTSTGNTVNFVIEVAYKRAVQTSYFQGTGPDGFAQTGDEVTLFGRESPEFAFGDSTIVRLLKMTVTAFSIQEDWIMGEVKLSHEYPSPTDDGAAWVASFGGCCRLSSIQNNQGAPYLLTAEVDLSSSNQSPRAVILPEVTVVSKFDGTPSFFYIPGYDPSKRAAVYWSLGLPFKVGDAGGFSKGSSLAVRLLPFQDGVDTSGYQVACARVGRSPANASSIAPGCFFELLKMVPPNPVGVAGGADSANAAGSPALTVEGWVKVGPTGGVVLSVGAAHNVPGAATAPPAECRPGAANYVQKCELALLYVELNRTHVTVGHERPSGATGPAVLNTRSFEAASNADLAANLQDTGVYSNGDTEPGLVNKWVHITVVRKMRWQADPAFFGASYKVYVNGYPLELQRYTSIAAPATGATCAGLGRYAASRCGALSPRDGFDGGESDAVPAYGPADAAVWPTLGKYASVLFGLYNGTAGARADVDASLDEWRFWNGARTAAATVATLGRALNPATAAANGDPTVTAGGPTGLVGLDNYMVEAVLLADYNFDSDLSVLHASATGLSCPGATASGQVSCKYIEALTPIYPGCAAADASVPCPAAYLVSDLRLAGVDKAIYRARSPGLCDDASGPDYCPSRADTDNHGVVFYEDAPGVALPAVSPLSGRLQLKLSSPGRYQVAVRLALAGGVSSVPVDFLVVVLPDPSVMPTLNVFAAARGGVYVGAAAAAATGGGGGGAGLVSAPLYPNGLTVYAGTAAELLVQGSSDVSSVGYTVGPAPPAARFGAVRGTNHSSMSMRWTPCAADVGVVTLCLDAVTYANPWMSTGPSPARPVADNSVSSEMACVQFAVVPDPPPVFANATPAAAEFTIGRAASFAVLAEDDNCADAVAVDAVPRAGAPAGAPALPQGAVLGPPGGYESTRNAYCRNAVKRVVTWTPPPSYGGFNEEVCFSATDTQGVATGGFCPGLQPHVTIRCVLVTVLRCKYALKKDQHLEDISKIFGLNWYTLWSLNPSLRHPDYFVHSGQTLNIGHLYRAGPNEVASAVARRMGMPAGQLLLLNHDLSAAAAGAALAEGQVLCVAPTPCAAPHDSPFAGLQYVDGRFVANASDPAAW